jgi:glycosyltransferase involved in cell wall biosynthesis
MSKGSVTPSHGPEKDQRRADTIRVAAFAARGPHSPSFRIRGAIPAAALSDFGIDVSLVPLFSACQERAFRMGGSRRRASTILAARRALISRLPLPADVAWILRQIDMLPSLRLEKLAISDHRLTLDIDDPIWLDTTRAAGGHPLAFLKGTRRKVIALARRADQVVAGNEHLADWLSDYTSHITVIPSVVDVSNSVHRKHRESETVLLGWIGSPSSFRHLRNLVIPLARAATEAPDIRFQLWSMGAGAPLDVPGMKCHSVAWTEAGESSLLERMDIGLMPLSDDPWTRGKCAYKALQYMAAGIPVVADDVGVSAKVIGDGHAGYVVSSPEAWSEALVSLSRDVSVRAQLGDRGRKRVIADYSLERWLPELAKALTGDTFDRSGNDNERSP